MQTQRIVASEMFSTVQAFVRDSGIATCNADDPEFVAEMLRYIDLSCFNLHKRIDSEGTLFEWYVPVTQGCFALPQECREARQIGINGLPLKQRSEFYIGKVATGQAYDGCSPWECRDLGDFYLPQYLPKQRGIRIAFVATDDGDAGKEIVIEVRNEYGQPVKETLVLLANQQPVITASVAFDVTFLKKPKTYGAVQLQLAYDDGQRMHFAVLHPDTEECLWRRKQLPANSVGWGCKIARILGKLRYVKVTSADQVLAFNDPFALGYAVQATSAYFRRDHEDYAAKMILALQELKKQMEDGDSPANVRQVNVRTYSGNRSQASNNKAWA